MPLRPFQQVCVDYLADQPSCIIGDDMGLGKTVEAIALDKLRRSESATPRKRTLVICPKSVISSWVDHFKEWQPTLKVFSIDTKNRALFQKAVADGNHDVYVMNWDAVRLMPVLAKYSWFHIIADEAHRIGNRDTQVTVASKRLKRQYLSELTGTPMTARPDQFWSLLNWAQPKVWTSYWKFNRRYVDGERHDTSGYCQADAGNGEVCGKYHKIAFSVIKGILNAEELQDLIRPYFIRRLKEDVLPELPDKTYSTIHVDLDPKQRRVYNEMRDQMLTWIGEHEDEPFAAASAVSKLVRLQQLACAYAQMDWITVKKKDPDTGAWKEIRKRQITLIDPSSKLDAVMEVIRDNPTTPLVVFSQSKQVIRLFAERLAAAKIAHGIFTGDTAQADRGLMVEAFQAGHLQVFAGTIQAGGEGITLTRASTVIFLDRTWSPAKNRQAEDRLHRIGQKDAVNVIDIVARDTIDAGRLQRIEQNWGFIKQMLGDTK